MEDTEDYCPGGFHPVELGDQLDDWYESIHKLGAGKRSTVWLAQVIEEQRYFAVKILRANIGGLPDMVGILNMSVSKILVQSTCR